ncbi:MAG: MotA/TolQ/ExbB proton channel family protein [Pseudomonadales bacterium]|nr:MotA/TolQ/ExbB proton channel family protein [Pseudomonadales bacterium]
MLHPTQTLTAMFAILLILMTTTPVAFAADENPTATNSSVGTPESSPIESIAPGDAEQGPQELSLLGLINKGGVVGYLIIVISILALGLAIDNFASIRRTRIMPEADINQLKKLIDNGELDKVTLLDDKNGSYLLRVTVAGIKEAHMGYESMIKTMEDTAEALASSIARRTEHLNVIGSISPMLGLLGTVIGMLQVFNEIAITPGAIEPRQLAEGIFQALVTTCLGLTVAIPALYGYAIFRNRVDELTGEAALAAEQLISSFKPTKD